MGWTTVDAVVVSNKLMQELPFDQAEVFVRGNFLPLDLCLELVDIIENSRQPSTVADFNGDYTFRTSETCFMTFNHPAVEEVERLLYEVSRIEPVYGEPLQGQRYEVGQEFKPHYDYFNYGTADYFKYCSVSGQRTWTYMIYLNDVEQGGGTDFPVLGTTIQPETGKLLAWNNRCPDGSVNPNTLHHGMKVEKGLKYIVTKWYRERWWQ